MPQQLNQEERLTSSNVIQAQANILGNPHSRHLFIRIKQPPHFLLGELT
jgi:hypothetical protein